MQLSLMTVTSNIVKKNVVHENHVVVKETILCDQFTNRGDDS